MAIIASTPSTCGGFKGHWFASLQRLECQSHNNNLKLIDFLEKTFSTVKYLTLYFLRVIFSMKFLL